MIASFSFTARGFLAIYQLVGESIVLQCDWLRELKRETTTCSWFIAHVHPDLFRQWRREKMSYSFPRCKFFKLLRAIEVPKAGAITRQCTYSLYLPRLICGLVTPMREFPNRVIKLSGNGERKLQANQSGSLRPHAISGDFFYRQV